jgi:transcriptional regulator with XRE-family HTH domain
MRGDSLKFGNRLKHYRLEHNMSQQELASQLNVTSQAVSKWENNISEPDFQIIRRVTELFKISYDQLFLDIDNGVYKGLLIKGEKDQNIGKWYLFTIIFLSALLVSLMFITSFTFASQELTWHFPLIFGLGSVLVFFFLCRVSRWSFHFRNNPDILFEIYGDRIKSLIDNTIIPFEYVKKIKVVNYRFNENIGKIYIQYTEHNKLIIRDVKNPAQIRSLLSEIAYKKTQ